MTKTKSTKRALLSSVLALLLCVSMLVGTTFAWFTDSVTSGNNKIVAGNLDVVLQYKTDWDDEWATVDENTKIFKEGALYEPGYTEVVYLRVSNAGSLALKYNLMVNIASEKASTNVNGKEFKLSDYLQIGTCCQDEYSSGFNYADILMPTMFGTREAALSNVTLAKLSTADSIVASNAPVLAGEQTAQVMAIVLTMPETVGNEANYKSGAAAPEINLGINLIATQYTDEEDSFGSDYDKDAQPVVVRAAGELAAALTSDKEIISVVLANDIDVPMGSLGTQTPGSGEYKLGGANTKDIIIDLGGNKLNISTTYMSAIGAKNDDATITIKNGTMSSSGNKASTWNINDLIFANCNYVIENVTFNKEVALENTGKNATFKNVTINGTGDYYALWISARGQDVEIDGLTINTVGRGIKIDEQYVSAPEKVTLSISNATFNTNKKAAIIVKSAAGADIALSDVNIAGVAADPFNAVWVDEDASSYAGLVTVNGGTKIVEGSAEAPKANSVAAGTTVTMNSVITAGDQTVINNEGTIDLSGKPNLNGGDVVVNGGTVVTTSANYTGLQHAGEVTYNNVTFDGSTFLYGEKVVFNNCTFNLTTNYVWTYGAKEVEFNNCTFNTNGKAVLIYTEDTAFSGVVTINGCTFNATAPAYASAVPSQSCAAVEIDSSLINGSYTVNFIGENVVDADFSGLVRVKKGSEKNNVTINGATPVTLP